MASLKLEGMVIGRGGSALAPPLDLVLSPGEALIVTGPNGAGKSTLLRTLAGLVPPVAGRISVEGFIAPDGEPATSPRQACHYIGHKNGLKPHQTLAGNVAFWRSYLGGTGSADSVDAALHSLGLAPLAGLAAGYLSAGQQRRAALCRLSVAQRPVWLLDEPGNALDAEAQRLFAALVARHRAEGGLVVAATHQPLDIPAARALALVAPAQKHGVVAPAIAEAWEW